MLAGWHLELAKWLTTVIVYRLPFTVSLQNTRSQTRNDLNLFFVSIEGFPIFHMFPCVWNIRHHPSLQPFMFVNTWSHAVWGHQASRCLEDGVLGEGTAMLGALVVWLHHGDENGEPLWTRLQWSFPNMNNLTSCLGALRKRSMRIQVDQVDSFTQRLMKPLCHLRGFFGKLDVHVPFRCPSLSPLSTDSGQRWSWVIRNHVRKMQDLMACTPFLWNHPPKKPDLIPKSIQL